MDATPASRASRNAGTASLPTCASSSKKRRCRKKASKHHPRPSRDRLVDAPGNDLAHHPALILHFVDGKGRIVEISLVVERNRPCHPDKANVVQRLRHLFRID